MTIWKFTLAIRPGEQYVRMPAGAHVLRVQLQMGAPVLWALVDPEQTPFERTILCVETGGDFPDGGDRPYRFIDTLQFEAGVYVLHVFERANAPR